MNLESYTLPKREEKDKITNSRQDFLKMFLDVKVNGIMIKSRKKGEGYVPIDASSLANVLAHVPTYDLYAFYKQCENAKHFGKYFWWALKPKK